jgi:pilin isopeptide linkage protein/fimbrial isopeptide formation D2 family protein/uncharacterized repeat protein (TIGR01451 family)/LPXTG-motif cell wall-anchored protein
MNGRMSGVWRKHRNGVYKVLSFVLSFLMVFNQLNVESWAAPLVSDAMSQETSAVSAQADGDTADPGSASAVDATSAADSDASAPETTAADASSTPASSDEGSSAATTPDPAATQSVIDALPDASADGFEVTSDNHDALTQKANAASQAVSSFVDAGGDESRLDETRLDALTAALAAYQGDTGISAAAVGDVYWNPDSVTQTNPDGSIKTKGGSDSYDGSSAAYPVLTWAKAKSLALGGSGTVIIMSTVNMTDNSAGITSTFTMDGADSLGNAAITLEQYEGSPEEMFLVAPGCQLTLKDIDLRAAAGYESSTMIRLAQSLESDPTTSGILALDQNVSITGNVQIETNAKSQTNMAHIVVTDAFRANPPTSKVSLYCSDINDSQVYDRADVVVPTTDTGDEHLVDYFSLSSLNTDAEWSVRQHLNDDSTTTNALQLYRVYKYTAVYVNGQTGSDDNFGGNCSYPVKTFDRAKQIVQDETWLDTVTERDIYVCDTIDVSGTESWDLSDCATYGTKMLSCPNPDDKHDVVDTMVCVKDGGSLTTKGMTIEHDESAAASVNVSVEAGGTYTLDEGTVLTGGDAVKQGTGIKVVGASGKTTKVSLEGAASTTKVTNRSQGLNVTGVAGEEGSTVVDMSGAAVTGNSQENYFSTSINGGGMSVVSATLTMTGGNIDSNYTKQFASGKYGTSNSALTGGGGIYAVGSTLDISGGSISNNTAYGWNGTNWDRASHGGGIYAKGGTTINLSGTATISSNSALRGCGGGIWLYDGSCLNMTGGTIDSNYAGHDWDNYNLNNNPSGGGIAAYNAAVNMSAGTISGNTASGCGGGIAAYEANTSGAFGSTVGLNVTGGTITANAARIGGGIATQAVANLTSVIDDATISDNTAAVDAGGVMSRGFTNMTGGEVSGNTATSGAAGGLYQFDGSMTLRCTGVTISGNTAPNGGGVFVRDGSAILDGVTVSDNTANGTGTTATGTTSGGGGAYVYNPYNGNLIVKGGSTFTGNTAASGLGDSIYSCKYSSITDSTITDADATGYGLYYNTTSGSRNNYAGANCIDPASCTLSTRIYLNTPASKLTLLSPVSTTDTGTLPINVNDDPEEGFTNGSVVLTNTYGNIVIDGTTYNNADISTFYKYFKGGTIPAGTQLTGYDKNIVLVGEGVYLDGTNGDDAKDGTTPGTAVKTYAQARLLLGKYVSEAEADAADTDGFEPYIYVCGLVRITGEETWSLDPASPDLQQSDKNTTTPQVKRFASYNGTAGGERRSLVEVATGGTLTTEKILFDDNMYGIDTSVTNSGANRILSNTGGTLNITGGTTLQNCWGYAVYMGSSSGVTTMSGDALITRQHGHAVYGDSGKFVMRADASGVSPTIDMTPFKGTINSADAYGINVRGTSSIVVLNDDSSIVGTRLDTSSTTYDGRRGIYINGGASATMNDTAHVLSDYTGNGGFVQLEGTNSKFTMNGSSYITSSSIPAGTRVNDWGIMEYCSACKVEMNDSSSIYGVECGILVWEGKGNSTTLNDNASIHGTGPYANNYFDAAGCGIYVRDRVTAATITLNGSAQIYDCPTAGISLRNTYDAGTAVGLHTVNLNDDALIGSADTTAKAANLYGIVESGSGSTINMTGSSRVAGNTADGIYIDRSDDGQGRYYKGIVTVNMSGASSVDHNGGNGIVTKDGVASYYQDAAINLTDAASIHDNAQRGVVLVRNGTLSLGAGTSITGNKSTEEYGKAVYAAGAVTLDAAAVVDDEMYFTTAANHITLTDTTGVGAGTLKASGLKVGYGEALIGAVFVEPDGTSVTDATTYYDDFNPPAHNPEGHDEVKKADGKIWILGENNVYLAGDFISGGTSVAGDDANNGASVGTPVRTFARAKEILATLEPGANIIICNYTVTPKDGDTTWSLDEGGDFTNASGETWQPEIVRYKDYTGALVTQGNQDVTFENLTFDGNSGATTATTNGPLVFQNYATRLTTTNCTFQNAYTTGNGCNGGGNKADMGGYATSILCWKAGGTLEMTGCTVTGNGATYGYTGNDGGTASAIYSNGANVSIDGCSFTGNETTVTSNVRISGSLIRGVGGSLSINDTDISNNVASASSHDYGLVFVQGACTTSITGSTSISDNSVVTTGNSLAGGVLTIASTTTGDTTIGAGVRICDNTATAPNANNVRSAGIFSDTATGNVSIGAATISGNVGGTYGGAMFLSRGGTVTVSGATITGNVATSGAAIYLNDDGPDLILRGGLISDNTPAGVTAPSRGTQSGIYCNGDGLQLKGGGCVINDYIYLTDTSNPITLSGSIYQSGRNYNVDMGPSFTKGSTVVRPDGNVITDASQYLKYFTAQKSGYLLAKESPDLVLKACIFIDSEHGSDTNNGATPEEAVATFARAKALGQLTGKNGDANYIICVSGPVYPTGSETWTLPDSCSMIRYVGFSVSETYFDSYDGPMIVMDSGDTVTLGDATTGCAIYGRRDIDTIVGDSVFKVGDGATLNVTNATIARNQVNGTGALIDVAAGGTANISGGTLFGGEATKGSAVYVDVTKGDSDTYAKGKLSLSGTPDITGDIYLNGLAATDDACAYVDADASYAPATGTTCSIDMANPYSKRPVVKYPAGADPTTDQIGLYSLSTDVTAVYELTNRASDNDMLELQQKGYVYVDGVNGSDTNAGHTPDASVKTLKRAYEILAESDRGGLITIVDTVTIDGSTGKITLDNSSSGSVSKATYTDDAGTVDAGDAVYIRRYSQPTAHADLDGYTHASCTGSLFDVTGGGSLVLDGTAGVTIDGHSNDVTGVEQFAAPAVQAQSALVKVSGGTFEGTKNAKLTSNDNAATDGKGGAVDIESGTFQQHGASIVSTSAEKGSAVYDNGTYVISNQPVVEGQVYLAGSGSAASSRYIVVDAVGEAPNKATTGSIDVVLEDPYYTREVAQFPDGIASGDYRSWFAMQTDVTDSYLVWNRDARTNVASDSNKLELTYRPCVYVDGTAGSDSNDGTTPDTSVATLAKAYKLLKTYGYGTILVVDTVTLPSGDVTLTNSTYDDGTTKVELSGPGATIQRYAQPDTHLVLAGYAHATNGNALLGVGAGTSLAITDLVMDGHSQPTTGDTYPAYERVSSATKSSAALIHTSGVGTLTLGDGCLLRDNDNTASGTSGLGGAVDNEGITDFDGATVSGCSAAKGAGIYQAGTLTFMSGTTGMGDQGVYLATDNTGTEADPVWGTDHKIVMQDTSLKDAVDYSLTVDMDHAVRGRDVVTYGTSAAFAGPTVMSESVRYTLGSTVPSTLGKVASATEADTIELQNYDVTYDGNGADSGDAPTDPSNSYLPGATATVLGNVATTPLAKAGCTLMGWNTKADGTGTQYAVGDTITMDSDVHLYAMWMQAEKTSTTPEDGVLRPGQVITYSIVVSMPTDVTGVTVNDPIPTNTTYVEGSASDGGSLVDGHVTWSLGDMAKGVSKTLTFKVTVSDTVSAGTKVTNVASIGADGHTYDSTETSDTVSETHTVTYAANDATGDVPTDATHYLTSESATVLGNVGATPLAKDGATFAGWNTKADGTGTHYDAGDEIAMTSDVTLTAMWVGGTKTVAQPDPDLLKPGQELTYTIEVTVPEATSAATVTDTLPAHVTYVGDSADKGGTFDEGTNTVTWDLGAATAGQTFSVSFKATVDADAPADTAISNKAAIAIGGNSYDTTTATSTVGEVHTVTYHGGNSTSGTAPVDQNHYGVDEKATVLGNVGDDPLAKTDGTFAGWNTKADGTGTHYDAGDEIQMTEDVDLYAMWVSGVKTVAQRNPGLLKPGQILTYTIKVTVPEAADTVIVTDTMPEHVSYISGSSSDNGSFNWSNSTLTWTITNATARTTYTRTFMVTVDTDTLAGTVISNKASIAIGGTSYDTTTATSTVGDFYHVVYHGNGETFGNVPNDRNLYGTDEKATVLGNVAVSQLAKDGSSFAGWNTKADGSGTHYDAGDEISMTEDVDLYAMWVGGVKTAVQQDADSLRPGDEITYTIDVTVPEASSSVVVTDAIPEGTAYVANSASEPGTFDNGKITWSYSDAEAGAQYACTFKVKLLAPLAAGTEISNQAGINVNGSTYYTETVRNTVEETHTVTYEPNWATGDVPTDAKYYLPTESATVLGNVGTTPLTNGGAQFAGWNTEADGSGTHYDAGDTIEMSDDVTLYAMWVVVAKDVAQPNESTLRPGEVLTYTIFVMAPDSSATASVTDAIPAGTEYVEGSASLGATYANGSITWSFNNLTAYIPVKLSFQVRVSDDAVVGQEISNQASVVMGKNSFLTNPVKSTVTSEAGSVSQDPPVAKTVTGDTPDTAGTFTFTMTPGTATDPMPAGADTGTAMTTTIHGTGAVEFGEITFVKPGTYTYTLAETNLAQEGYAYDTTVYTMTVVVTNVDGQLQKEVTYADGDGKAVSSMDFTNVYTAPPVEPIQPTEPNGQPTDQPTSSVSDVIPKTGDTTGSALPMTLALAGMAIAAGVIVRRRRNG